MKASRESANSGQDQEARVARPPIATMATPAMAPPLRQLLHLGRGTLAAWVGGLNGRSKEPSMRREARALAISVPEALAGNPHDAQTVAAAAFALSHAKQRQR